jgi:hypothetical protein
MHLFRLFAMGSSSFSNSPYRFCINLAMRISVRKQKYSLVIVNMLVFMVFFRETYLFCHIRDIVNYLHWIIIIILVTHLEWDYLSC